MNICRRLLSSLIVVSFVATYIVPTRSFAANGGVLGLPMPGTMLNLSPAYVPVLMKGVHVHPENPLLFDFIIDTGHSGLNSDTPQLRQESEKLIKYFLATLTIPEQDLWVNLSPYEKDRMINKDLGQTEMGRDMLAQDYMLKQMTASLIYPEKELGKKFWDKVYSQARQKFGSTEIPVNTFNKVWILPDKASVFVRNNTAYVVEGHLKVMLEEDYLALQKHENNAAATVMPAEAGIHSVGSQIVKDIILPELEKEINTGKNFAPLRQIFYSLVLASWYKNNLKEALLNQVYTDKDKVSGVNVDDKAIGQKIYQQYLAAYKKGVFNYIKDDTDRLSRQPIPRKYFSGGEVWNNFPIDTNPAMAIVQKGLGADGAMLSVQTTVEGTGAGNNIMQQLLEQPREARPSFLVRRILNTFVDADPKGRITKFPSGMAEKAGEWEQQKEELLSRSNRGRLREIGISLGLTDKWSMPLETIAVRLFFLGLDPFRIDAAMNAVEINDAIGTMLVNLGNSPDRHGIVVLLKGKSEDMVKIYNFILEKKPDLTGILRLGQPEGDQMETYATAGGVVRRILAEVQASLNVVTPAAVHDFMEKAGVFAMGLNPVEVGYFAALLLKYFNEREDLKIAQQFIPSPSITVDVRQTLMGAFDANSIAADPRNQEIAKTINLRVDEMNGGLGSSFKRAATLMRLLNRTKLGPKAADSYFENIPVEGKDAAGNRIMRPVNVSVAEMKLLHYVWLSQQNKFGTIEVEEMVNEESQGPVRAFYDTTYLPDRVDDTIAKDQKRTYRQVFASIPGLKLVDEMIVQGVYPVINEETKQLVNAPEVNAPGGHAVLGTYVVDRISTKPPAQAHTVTAIVNGDGVNNMVTPEVAGYAIRTNRPIIMLTTTRTGIDIKGGIIGLRSANPLTPQLAAKILKGEVLSLQELQSLTLTPDIMELAQANLAGQGPIFQDLGISVGENGGGVFNTNVSLYNETVLHDILSELRKILTDDEFFQALAPDLIPNPKDKPLGGKDIFVSQMEGAKGSTLLNLNKFYMTSNKPGMEKLRADFKTKYGIDRLVYFVNFDAEHRTEVFTPEKYTWDHVLYYRTDLFGVDSSTGRLERTVQPGEDPGHLPQVEFSDYYADLENVTQAFGRQVSMSRLNSLEIKGKIKGKSGVNFANAIMIGNVYVENNSADLVDLNAHQDRFKTEGGRLVLDNVRIVIAEDGTIDVSPDRVAIAASEMNTVGLTDDLIDHTNDAAMNTTLAEGTRTLKSIQINIERGYDVRGFAIGPKATMTPDTLYAAGNALGLELNDRIQGRRPRVLVTGDQRSTSPSLRQAVSEGLAFQGVDVDFSNEFISTPVANVIPRLSGSGYDAEVQITASHNAWTKHMESERNADGSYKEHDPENGFKINILEPDGQFRGVYGQGMWNILSRSFSPDAEKAGAQPGQIKEVKILDRYYSHLADLFKKNLISLGLTLEEAQKQLVLVVDTGNGVMGPIAKAVIQEKLGIQYVGIDDEVISSVDGIPAHEADPSKRPVYAQHLTEEVQKAAQKPENQSKIVLGLAFDGDGDRIGMTDENGAQYLTPNQQGYFLFSRMKQTNPHSGIVLDIRAGQEIIEELGLKAKDAKWHAPGWPVVRKAMQDNGADIAVEGSHHTMLRQFEDRNTDAIDDGLYVGLFAAAQALKLRTQGQSLHQLLDRAWYPSLVEELRPAVAESTAGDRYELMPLIAANLTTQVNKKYAGAQIDGIDSPGERGAVRLQISAGDGSFIGWILMRASNTSPRLSMQVQGKDNETLVALAGILGDVLQQFPKVNQDDVSNVLAKTLANPAQLVDYAQNDEMSLDRGLTRRNFLKVPPVLAATALLGRAGQAAENKKPPVMIRFKGGQSLQEGDLVARSGLKGKFRITHIEVVRKTPTTYILMFDRGPKLILYSNDWPANELKKLTELADTDPAMNGGIDFNAKNLNTAVSGDKVDIRFDQAMMAQFKAGDFSGVRPVIMSVTPIPSVLPWLGLAPRKEDDILAKT